MNPTISVLYSCHQCGLKKIAVAVPARTDEDVVVWVETIMGRRLAGDHAQRSPHCHPDTLDEVMIPMTGTDRVGGAPVQ